MTSAAAGALFCVKTTIQADHDEAFNAWYDEHHVPGMLEYPAVVSGRRYRQLSGDDGFQYMAVYEFTDRAAMSGFFKSEHFRALMADYQKVWPPPLSTYSASTYEIR